MPITQDRMMAIIEVARDFKDAMAKTVALVEREATLVRQGKADARDVLDRLEILIKHDGMLTNPIQSTELLAIEWMHFKGMRRKNENAARRAAAKRETQGTPIRNASHLQTAATEFLPKFKAAQAAGAGTLETIALHTPDARLPVAPKTTPPPSPSPNPSSRTPPIPRFQKEYDPATTAEAIAEIQGRGFDYPDDIFQAELAKHAKGAEKG